MTNKKTIDLLKFFSNELRDFFIFDCDRSIPSGIDGLKPSQRKIIYGIAKKYANQEIKVSLAAAGVAEISCYHHGSTSLEGAIVKMAQDFSGANNVPLLEPIGQFGSRIADDASASRYISTKISPNFRKLFKEEDDDILKYLEDDGQSIEPDFFLPILPTVLINGGSGIGTGYACEIFNYSIKDVRDECLKELGGMRGKRSVLIPHYEKFTGDISRNGKKVKFVGKCEIASPTKIIITELPIGVYTTAYRQVLNSLEDQKIIKNYTDESTENQTKFVVSCTREFTQNNTVEQMLDIFSLIKNESENVTVWVDGGKIKHFESVDDLLTWFVAFRLPFFEQRRQKQISECSKKIKSLEEKIRFIQFYLNDPVTFSKASKEVLEKRLTDEGFDDIVSLMQIRIYQLTKEQIEKSQEELTTLLKTLEELEGTDAKAIFIQELKEIKC